MKYFLPFLLMSILFVSRLNTSTAYEGKKSPSAKEDQIKIQVNPTINLFSLLQRFAGDTQYTEFLLPQYLLKLEQYFGHLRNHRTVKRVKEFKKFNNINGDAPMALAVYIGPPPALRANIDIDNLPPSFDPRWNKSLIEKYLENARLFAIESHFMKFYKSNLKLHKRAIANLSKSLNNEHIAHWFHKFFGYNPDNFKIYIALLNGSCSYGYPIYISRQKMVSVALLGARWPDSSGAPTYRRSWFLPLIIHEYCHSYINPLIAARADEFKKVGEALLVSHRQKMIERGYNVWNVILQEYLVRAITIRFLDENSGTLEAQKMARYDIKKGFPAIEGLLRILDKYELNRKKYPKIKYFLPEIKKYFLSCLDRKG